jgi:hypothetical protein
VVKIEQTGHKILPYAFVMFIFSWRQIVKQMPAIFYPHRKNNDGTYDSICTRCFATVARTYTEVALEEHDRRHVCTEAMLSQRSTLTPQHRASKMQS